MIEGRRRGGCGRGEASARLPAEQVLVQQSTHYCGICLKALDYLINRSVRAEETEASGSQRATIGRTIPRSAEGDPFHRGATPLDRGNWERVAAVDEPPAQLASVALYPRGGALKVLGHLGSRQLGRD
jgi:hypothetical protein